MVGEKIFPPPPPTTLRLAPYVGARITVAAAPAFGELKIEALVQE